MLEVNSREAVSDLMNRYGQSIRGCPFFLVASGLALTDFNDERIIEV
jgi:hypothetical protein